MDNRELIAIIKANRDNSLGADDGELSNERATALDHYHGRPYGNERVGRSSVVSKDLSEAVDWAMPAIMRVFTQSGNIAEFIPVGPEDEDGAQQESDTVNTVIMQDNNGFMVIHDAVKDALLLKNGYFKHYWDEQEKTEEEEYEGLTLDELTRMIIGLEQSGATIDVVAQEEKVINLNGVPVPVFDVRLRVTTKSGRCVIEAVPPEELRVSRKCRGSLQDSPFTEHVTRKYRSELLEMGMAKDFVDSLPSADSDLQSEVLSRDSVTDESGAVDMSYIDRAMDEIDYCEAYIRVDFDGDGVAELRKVVTVADQIPPGEEWNEVIPAVPVTGMVPKRVPHRHVGESLDDDLADLQEIKTTLTRQLLDNIYLTNDNQWLVNERVNIKDFMQSLPGGVKRVRGMEPVNGAASPVPSSPIVAQVLPVIDYFDGVKEGRTGINESTTGLDPDILRESTKGAFIENLNRASQKMEMVARMLAETGIKELVKQVHSILLRYQDKPRIMKLRGKYVEVNPREWKERNDLTVRVGIGTGTEEEKRERLMIVAGLQEKIAQVGLTGPRQVYALFTDIVKTLGFDLPEKYAIDPQSPEFAQLAQQQSGQENMLAEAEKIKGAFALQKSQFDAQVAQMKEQHKHEMNILRMQYDASEARAERASKEAIEAAKLEMQAFLAGAKVDIGPPGMGTMPEGA